MLVITIHADVPTGKAMEVKEDLAMYLEKFGDAKVVNIVEKGPEQMQIFKKL